MYNVPNIGTFFNTRNMNTLWDFVAVLVKFIAPGIMIVVAFFAVGMVLTIAIKAFKKGADDDEKRNKDDDYDMKYY